MKKIFAIAIVLLLVFGIVVPFFAGCEEVLNENGERVFADGGRFVVVEHNLTYGGNTFENWIIKDSRTGVLYMLIEAGAGDSHRIAMTVLMSPDGTPLTIEEWNR